jgi:hypothetical protein
VTTPTTDKTAVVIRLLGLLDEAAVSAQPADVLATVFDEILADDFVYQNRPQRAAVGKREFGKWMREFTGMASMECAILRIAATDDWVLTERVDSWSIRGHGVDADHGKLRSRRRWAGAILDGLRVLLPAVGGERADE